MSMNAGTGEGPEVRIKASAAEYGILSRVRPHARLCVLFAGLVR